MGFASDRVASPHAHGFGAEWDPAAQPFPVDPMLEYLDLGAGQSAHAPSGDFRSPRVKEDLSAAAASPPLGRRTGGRAPATAEDRKARNRQAQAAFRERRTEHIGTLERTVKSQTERIAAVEEHSARVTTENHHLRLEVARLQAQVADLQRTQNVPHYGFSAAGMPGAGQQSPW